MGFAQEMKDFVSAAEKGWKMMTPTPAEVKAAELKMAREQEQYRRSQFDKGGEGGRKGRPGVEAGATTDDEEKSGGFDSDTGTYTPSDKDLDIAVRTVYGEAAGESDEGQKAVAAVLKNRANLARTSLTAEALKPNQFEPWNNPVARRRMTTLKESDPRYQRIKSNVLAVIEEGEDPTKGATHFYAPTAQQKLGRATPSWAKGPKQTIGNHVFFKLPYSGRGQHGTEPAEERVLPASAPLPPRGRPAVEVATAEDGTPLPPVRPASATTAAPAGPIESVFPPVPVRKVKTVPASAVVVEPPPGTAIDSATGLPIAPDDPRINPDIQGRPVMPGRTSAIGLNPLLEEDPYLRAGIYAAKGGLVPSYADGGLAVSESAIDHDDMSDEDAEKYLSTPMDYVQLGARKGLDQIQTRFGLKSGAVPEESPRAQDGARALASNAGAPSPDDVKQLMSAVDRDGSMSEDQRAVHGWGNMIKYYTDRGNPQAAANAGAAMLMHSKRVSQQAGAMALAAMEKGDYDAAAKMIQAAYNTFPDGKTVRVNAAGEDGIEYEIVGDKGVGKSGKISPEELKELAQGMLNGTQWFQHAAQLTQGAKPADLAKQRRAKARTAFEEEEMDEKGFIATLSPEGKKKFAKLDPADKKEYMQRHLRETENQAKQERFTERNFLVDERREIDAGRRQERDARKEDMTIFKEALKQGRWEVVRDQTMTNFERSAALRERDLSDRNTRHRESLEARQKRYAEIDQRIMERTRGIGAKGGEKETAKEGAARRERTAIEQEAAGREGAVTREMSIGDDGELVPSFPQRTAVSAIRGGTGFRHLGPKGQELPDRDLEEITEKVGTAFKDESVTPADKLWLTQAAADIRSSQTERFTTDAALDMIKTAVKAPTEPVVDPRTGMVTIRPDLPPVYLSERSIIALAQMRQRARETSRKPRAEPAVPGISAPMRSTATGERAEAEQRAGSLRDRQLRAELGEAYEPGMTIPEMEAAVLAERARLSRSRRAIDLEHYETRQREEAEKRRRQRAIGNLPR